MAAELCHERLLLDEWDKYQSDYYIASLYWAMTITTTVLIRMPCCVPCCICAAPALIPSHRLAMNCSVPQHAVRISQETHGHT